MSRVRVGSFNPRQGVCLSRLDKADAKKSTAGRTNPGFRLGPHVLSSTVAGRQIVCAVGRDVSVSQLKQAGSRSRGYDSRTHEMKEQTSGSRFQGASLELTVDVGPEIVTREWDLETLTSSADGRFMVLDEEDRPRLLLSADELKGLTEVNDAR